MTKVINLFWQSTYIVLQVNYFYKYVDMFIFKDDWEQYVLYM